ncbi:hypothetical protein HYH02_010667 [Chlamydomonas schloesseri]|uniref:Mannosyl-oligosaccharide glucosidase n=1 Tax=Chlamydomonas schloesseri TaxID=2026947 RepID=A0A835W6E4_9CHLO|nr:hypothetical protein HYH02_010667 [Chlamydomonas schloesseri]|eukprot:KAG2438869.1 hypothetical protein HYH02_010667 [Chlamydomonas schloesseri]
MAPAKKGDKQKGLGGVPVTYIAGALLAAVAAAFFALRGRTHFTKGPILTPLKAPKVTDLLEFDAAYKDRMLWGSYRSGLYFGMRTRTPKGLVSGLMWFDPDDFATLQQYRVRHEASQGDGLGSYGWKRHDGRNYGQQILVDNDYNITLSMLKTFGEDSGPGGDWSLRLQLRRTTGMPTIRRRISVVIYIGDEDTPREPWQVLPDGEVTDLRPEPATLVTGASGALGRGGAKWALHAMELATEPPASTRSRGCRLDYLGMSTEGRKREYLLKARDILMSTMYERLQRQPPSDKFRLYLPNGATTNSDLAMFQVTCVIPSTVDFAFTSTSGDLSDYSERLEGLVGPGLDAPLAAAERAFDQRFDRVFGAGISRALQPQPQQAPDAAAAPADAAAAAADAAATVETAKAALSNLLGSMGYFYGSSLVRTGPPGSEPAPYWPAPLFTAVPSRSFFPRGFLWDEGFHQLLVQRWDPQLSRDVIGHWLDLLNSQGWIPREQILGEEARARVPAEFVVQNPTHANPPSLFLPIAHMAAQLVRAKAAAEASDGGASAAAPDAEAAEEELERMRTFLRRSWPRLAAWYNWFNATQAGPVPSSFRWHGRDPLAAAELNPKTLTSGLDDYPRASHPDDGERHLDLRCWMALASQAMYDIGSSLGLPPAAVERYAAAAAQLSDLRHLLDLHYDTGRGAFADWGTHTEEVALEVKSVVVPATEDGVPPQRRDVSERVARGWPAAQYVPQFGYVSLFPLIMRLLPTGNEQQQRAAAATAGQDGSSSNSSAGGAELTLQQLRLLTDSNLLWSEHGLRSLAKTASLYKKRNTADDPPYWRGQIWININYLVLRSLSYYARHGSPEVAAAAAAAHDELRRRLLRTLVGGYKRQGYLYEQYDDDTGRGTSSHPFTGWTALVTLIAAQEY